MRWFFIKLSMHHIFYLHGFKSHTNSVKGTLLKEYCVSHHPNIQVHLPDLNLPPHMAMEQIHKKIAQDQLTSLSFVGSSLGSFYANYLANYYNCAGVLINPAIRPWKLFENQIGFHQLPYLVTANWLLTIEDIYALKQYELADAQDLSKMLVLLQQGDETLDYKETQRYYSAHKVSSMMITECGGNHVMDNFAEKIPMLLVFLLQHLSLRNI